MSDADDAMMRGNTAFEAGDVPGALAEYERAVAALAPGDDVIAADLFENLGIAYWKLGRWTPALRALLRALDGDLGAREQCLRLLVSCYFRDGHAIDGERLLREYTDRFGPHPEGWTRNSALRPGIQ
ncbi:MAG: tetratricopeptide repeat protein [Myxococcales bacterium]|nr:tetratricopeptide repeat protein [Myxococcales bacterium]